MIFNLGGGDYEPSEALPWISRALWATSYKMPALGNEKTGTKYLLPSLSLERFFRICSFHSTLFLLRLIWARESLPPVPSYLHPSHWDGRSVRPQATSVLCASVSVPHAQQVSRAQDTSVGWLSSYSLMKENTKLCTFTQVIPVLGFSLLGIGSEAGITNDLA